MTIRSEMISGTFVWRRIHSLMGLWLIIYLIEHLIVNSQATLWLGDDGIGFIRLVNSLESLPYLQVIEIIFIGVPFALHMYWGVKRLFTAKMNSAKTDGSAPSLEYGRNKAFSWQRLTSWILIVGVIGHVLQMRFIQMPKEVRIDHQVMHVARITDDPGLDSVAERVGIALVRGQGNRVKAISPSPGKAMLFMVRDTFKNLWMCILYSVFVLAASFHAFNGFWTSLITWGAMLSYGSQKAMIPICWLGVGLLAFLGLTAIWGSYWLNLRT